MDTMALPELHVGRGSPAGPLTLFPVWTSEPAIEDLTVGVAAHVGVAECAGGPEVGSLALTNDGPHPALLLEGELLEGGWQHRALQHDVILFPGRSLVASVACVEAGRWRGGHHHVRRGRRASGAVRVALSSPDVRRRQGEVWSRVSAYDGAMGASPTSSYVDHLDTVAASQDIEKPKVLEGQRGVIVGLGGWPILLELFPSRQALDTALRDLLDGLLVDVAARSPAAAEPTPAHRARRLVEQLDGRRIGRASGVDAGDGDPRVLTTPTAEVRGLALADQWAHLTVFNRRHKLISVA